ncbi:MAG: hypothetical protein V2A34_00545 [Lentisphaerota bacterium]
MNTEAGFIARLLINESPFPGERGWLSEEDTKATMLSILWVLHCRIAYVPDGYEQVQVAAIQSQNIIDVITAGGEHGQCEGFYRDGAGRFVAVERVQARVNRLAGIAGQGTPGKFARLLQYGQGLASAYVKGGIDEADRFAGLKEIGRLKVTGRAYSWMSDKDYYNPGGLFVKIPDTAQGALGGNRFFTLKELSK